MTLHPFFTWTVISLRMHASHYLANLFLRKDGTKYPENEKPIPCWGVASRIWNAVHRALGPAQGIRVTVPPTLSKTQCSLQVKAGEELRWETEGERVSFSAWHNDSQPSFIFSVWTVRGTLMFSEKTELQEFTASTDRTSSCMSLSGSGYHLETKGFCLQENSWRVWLSWLPPTRFAWVWMNFPPPVTQSQMEGTDGPMVQDLFYCDLHSVWHCIPGAQTEGERWTWRAWILGSPRSSQKSVRWTWPTDLSLRVAAKGYLLLPDHPPCDSRVRHRHKPSHKTYIISGAVPGQLLRSTNQTASTLRHRPALWTELSCSQKTRVLGT